MSTIRKYMVNKAMYFLETGLEGQQEWNFQGGIDVIGLVAFKSGPVELHYFLNISVSIVNFTKICPLGRNPCDPNRIPRGRLCIKITNQNGNQQYLWS